jgi:hypothetical protein
MIRDRLACGYARMLPCRATSFSLAIPEMMRNTQNTDERNRPAKKQSSHQNGSDGSHARPAGPSVQHLLLRSSLPLRDVCTRLVLLGHKINILV